MAARMKQPAPLRLKLDFAPATGWMPGGYGTVRFSVVNQGSAPVRLERWSGKWQTGGQRPAKDSKTNILCTKLGGSLGIDVAGSGKAEFGRVCHLPEAVVARPAQQHVSMDIALTARCKGRQVRVPCSLSIPLAKLPEPLRRMEGRHVALELMTSRYRTFKHIGMMLRLLDASYAAMQDLTGFTPFKGERIILRECPDHPYYAYAGQPIVLGTTRAVQQELEHVGGGRYPFGWVHEMGHDFDFGGWYIWNGPACEWQANFKMMYCLETIPDAGLRHAASGAGSGYPRPSGETAMVESRAFMEGLWGFAGDAYLADPSRDWTSLRSDDIHAFHARLVRLYGWDSFKAWYRAFAWLEKKGLKRPSTPKGRMQLGAALLCEATGADLVTVYQRWRFPVTPSVIKRMRRVYPVAGAIRRARQQLARQA